MNASLPIRPPVADHELGHAYSPTCNCDACFEAWLTMPEPSAAEREARARQFMATLAPSSGGELLTDHPVTFPDLDGANNRGAGHPVPSFRDRFVDQWRGPR